MTLSADSLRGRPKHNFTTTSAQGWTLEAWTEGSRIRAVSPIDLTIRVTSSNDKIDGLPADAKLFLTLTLVGSSEPTRSVSCLPAYQRVKRDTLIDYSHYPGRPDQTILLCSGNSWEAIIQDAFGTDTYRPNAKPLPKGKYNIEISVSPAPDVSLRIVHFPVTIFLTPDD